MVEPDRASLRSAPTVLNRNEAHTMPTCAVIPVRAEVLPPTVEALQQAGLTETHIAQHLSTATIRVALQFTDCRHPPIPEDPCISWCCNPSGICEDPFCPDADDDGLCNWDDPDDDNDGIPDEDDPYPFDPCNADPCCGDPCCANEDPCDPECNETIDWCCGNTDPCDPDCGDPCLCLDCDDGGPGGHADP